MSKLPVSNDHNVYILGAGFSMTAGLPVMNGFLNRMRDALEAFQKDGREIEAQAIGEVLDYRLYASSAAYWANLDLENIEHLFSLATAARHPVSEVLPLAVAATLDFCRRQGQDGKVLVQPHDNATATRYRTVLGGGKSEWKEDAPRIYPLIESATEEGQTTYQIATFDFAHGRRCKLPDAHPQLGYELP